MLNFIRKMAGPPALTYPNADWLGEWMDIVSNTPDISRLQRYEYQRFFVYDEMQQGHEYNSLIAEYSVPISTAFTADRFTLWKKKLGEFSFPFALDLEYPTVKRGKIRGDLVVIEPHRFIQLDKLKLNGVHYTRKRVEVLIPYRVAGWSKEHGTITPPEEKVCKVWAWMYVGNPEFWEDQLDGGYSFGPVEMYEPNRILDDPKNNKKYYAFTQKEYFDPPD